jgi:hypothetical protein
MTKKSRVTRNEADKTTARERQRPGSTLLVETAVPIEVANLGSLLRDRCPDGEWNILHLAIDQPPWRLRRVSLTLSALAGVPRLVFPSESGGQLAAVGELPSGMAERFHRKRGARCRTDGI